MTNNTIKKMMSGKILPAKMLCVFAMVCGCSSSNKEPATSTLSSNLLELIQNAQSIEDLFLPDTTDLKIPRDFTIGELSTLHVTKDGSILIADERHAKTVLLFDSVGHFIRQIGRNGRGPGEYLRPRHLFTDQKNEIIISDVQQFRISFFDKDGRFLHSFSVPHDIWGVFASSRGEIIIHNQWGSRGKQTIFVYSERGKLLTKFGRTSKAYKELQVIPFAAHGPFLAIADEAFFEVDYPDYHIRKYWDRGQLQREFGVQPQEWRSLLTTNYRSLGVPKYADAASRQRLNKFMDSEFFKCSYVYCLQALAPGVLYTMIRNHKIDPSEDLSFDFYDTQGNLIKGGLKFRNFPRPPKSPPSILLPAIPDKLFFAQYIGDEEGAEQTIRLIWLKLKDQSI